MCETLHRSFLNCHAPIKESKSWVSVDECWILPVKHKIWTSWRECMNVGGQMRARIPTSSALVNRFNSDLKALKPICTFRELLHKSLPGPVHSQKRHRLNASCGFYRPDAIRQQVVYQACWLHQVASSLWTSDFLMKQLASSLHAVRNLQQVC